MAKLNAAELLARVRKRKQELLEQPAEASNAGPITSVSKQLKPNPYLEESAETNLAAAKPRLAIQASNSSIRVNDETELLYLPTNPPALGKEWWDEGKVETSSLVCRPSRIGLPLARTHDEGALVHLTPEERRRKRKQERAIKRQDAQERVRLGIDPPPPPKLKLSNVAGIIGSAFVHDPTRYEDLARSSERERREAHEKANMERKLTPEQKWLKHDAKVRNHRSQSLHTAVFRIEQLDDDTGKQNFLVDYTAKKFLFTGVALMGSPALVIVEGGEPEVVKFIKVLSRKIENCLLLWTGVISHPHFKAWSLHRFPSEPLKRDFLRKHRAIPYYLLMLDAPLSSDP